MQEQLAEIEAIASQSEAATLDNTLIPLERSGQTLKRVSALKTRPLKPPQRLTKGLPAWRHLLLPMQNARQRTYRLLLMLKVVILNWPHGTGIFMPKKYVNSAMISMPHNCAPTLR